MTDNHGYVLAPLPVAPVNETDMVLLPKSLNALKQVAKEVGLDLRGAYVNLAGGFDLTGCKFSVAQMLRSSAQIEGDRIRRERCAKKNAWDSEPA